MWALVAVAVVAECVSGGDQMFGWQDPGGLGWTEKFVEDDLELIIGESRFHEFDAVDVWQARDVVEKRWCGPAADFLMDLEGCSAAKFPGIQYECSGDGTIAFEGFGEEGDCLWGVPWVVPCISSGRVSE